MTKAQRIVAVVFVLLWVGCGTTPAPRVVRPPTPSPLARQLMAELATAGVRALVIERTGRALTSRRLRKILMARGVRAGALLDGSGGFEILALEDGALHRELILPKKVEPRREMVLRAVESLRAQLLVLPKAKVVAARRPREKRAVPAPDKSLWMPPDPPPPKPPAGRRERVIKTNEPQPDPEEPWTYWRPLRWELTAVGVALLSPGGGLDTQAQGGLALRRRLDDHWQLGALAVFPLGGVQERRQAADVAVHGGYGWLELTYHWRRRSALLRPYLGAALGVCVVRLEVTAHHQGYQEQDQTRWAALTGIRSGLRIGLGDRFLVQVEVLLALASPYAVLEIADEEVGVLGRPLLGLSLGLGVTF